MILSTGMASEIEIGEAVATAHKFGCQHLSLLHCISSYPAPFEEAHLRQIPVLIKKFKLPVGLSDHTLGTSAAVAAIALGACVVEKHFTLSRSDKGPDCKFSLEPHELRKLCQDAKNAWLALGGPGFCRGKSEEKGKIFRRSLYFTKDLPAGHVVSAEDIRRIRPGMGLPCKEIKKIPGRRLKKPVLRGQPTSWDLFES
jgi:N-acetylneuraminate synthase